MAFIDLVAEEHAGDAADLLAGRPRAARVPPELRARRSRTGPSVYRAWRALLRAVTANMDERRYELATVAAARRLRSSYCMLSHGKVLADKFLTEGEVEALARAEPTEALDDVERAVMELADKVAGDATSVTQEDVDRLRAHGLSDAEIADVVLAAAARCFFSKTLDGLGVEPDAAYLELAAVLARRPHRRPADRGCVRILVVGTGGVGSAFAAIAARRSFFDHCALADYDPARPAAVAASLDDGRFSAHRHRRVEPRGCPRR